MRQPSMGEMAVLAADFFEFLKIESSVCQSLPRDYLKNYVYEEFMKLHGAKYKKKGKSPSFSTLLFCMKSKGFIRGDSKNNTITLLQCNTSHSAMRQLVAVDAMAVEKRKRGRKENKMREVQRKLVDSVSVPSEMDCENSLGLAISCMAPSVEHEQGLFICLVEDGSEAMSMLKIVVKNTTGSHKFLLDCRVLSKTSEITVAKPERKRLRAHQELVIDVTCNVKWNQPGACKSAILFTFSQTISENSIPFHMTRFVRFEKTNELINRLKPEKPYVPPVKVSKVPYKTIMRGKRPAGLATDKLEKKVVLMEYPVPNNVKLAVQDGAFVRDSDVTGYKQLRQVLENPLNETSYGKRFNLLLHLEELQNTVDIRRYDMTSVCMVKEGKLMYLSVPGLAEKRPSVLRGDRIYVTMTGDDGQEVAKEFEGFVHVVERDRVGIAFHHELLARCKPNTTYNARFTFNRLPMKLEHRAVSAKLPWQMIFPKKCGTLYSDIKILKEEFVNKAVSSNPEQSKAVNNIVRGKQSSVPYIVFGPPGTGKTVTIVEAILQIVRIYEGCHVLVCAPSNSACDLLTQKLLRHVRRDNIFRMHAASRNWREVPSDVKRVSNHDGTDFYFPPKKELGEYEILVCTLITAGRLASAKFPDDHFTHVFIDEAGQATEPEFMVAVSGVLAEGGQVVMAGDPKQLGPVIMSAAAKEYGLGVSFLERLMENETLYQKDEKQCYNPQFITKLLINYRSHESIIEVPNETFYENELIAGADKNMVNALCSWHHLPQPGFPVIFEGVRGEDLRESTSPSYYNPQEIFIVKTYIERLLLTGVVPSDVGVITPYRKQVQKLKGVLNHSELKVGSVEEFQGQERRVIVISTVRSDSQHLLFDANHNLGFLCNPKRFNVAVTRAKSLLIVIGNPHLLSLDYHWKNFLEYCIENNAYRGIEYDNDKKRDIDVDEIEQIFQTGLQISDD